MFCIKLFAFLLTVIYENGGPIAFVDMGKVHTNILFVNFNNILAVEVVKRLAKVPVFPEYYLFIGFLNCVHRTDVHT